MADTSISTQMFGNTDQKVTIVGLGGEGVLRTFGQEVVAEDVIREALSQGITYFDSARAYSGSESYYGRVWSKNSDAREKVFQTSKSAMRQKKAALADLDQPLSNMGIDHLDLWQIHDVRTEDDMKVIAGSGGALEAFVEAKAAGKIRFIGVTGHHDPGILAVKEWPVDAVLMPVNPVEAVLGGFLDDTLNTAKEKGIAVIAMKVLGASYYLSPEAGVTAQALIHFALSQPVNLAIVGCSSPEEVNVLADAGRDFQPMSDDEQQRLISLFRPHARKLGYYRGV